MRWVAGGCEAMFTPRTLGLVHDMAAALGNDVEIALQTGIDRAELFNDVLTS